MWLAVLLGALGCYASKLAGVSIPARLVDNERFRRVVTLLPMALLATLVVTQTFSSGRALAVDARAMGLAAAAMVQMRRAPFLVVVAVAAAATAVTRLAV